MISIFISFVLRTYSQRTLRCIDQRNDEPTTYTYERETTPKLRIVTEAVTAGIPAFHGKKSYDWMKSGGIGSEKVLVKEEIKREKERLKEEAKAARDTKRMKKKQKKDEEKKVNKTSETEVEIDTKIPLAPTGT